MASASAAFAGSSGLQSVLKMKSKAMAAGFAAASLSIRSAVCARVHSFSGDPVAHRRRHGLGEGVEIGFALPFQRIPAEKEERRRAGKACHEAGGKGSLSLGDHGRHG